VNKSFERAMGFLGVKYKKNDDEIVVIDVSKLEKGLKK
jgi:hypothetical protein